MKKLITTSVVAASLLATAASASELTVLFSRGAGSADRIATIMQPYLEKKGVKLNIVFLKSCADSVMQTKSSNKNVVMALTNADYTPSPNAECRINGISDGFYVYQELVSSPNYLCFTKSAVENPAFTKTVADLSAATPIRIGAYTSGVAQISFLKEQQSWTYTEIPFTSGSSLLQASVAGDIEAVFGSAIGMVVQSAGGKCILATGTPNLLNIPHINTVLKKPVGEFTARFVWWAYGSIDSSITKAIAEVKADPEYKAQIIKEIKGYPSTATGEESFKEIRDGYLLLDRKNIK